MLLFVGVATNSSTLCQSRWTFTTHGPSLSGPFALCQSIAALLPADAFLLLSLATGLAENEHAYYIGLELFAMAAACTGINQKASWRCRMKNESLSRMLHTSLSRLMLGIWGRQLSGLLRTALLLLWQICTRFQSAARRKSSADAINAEAA